MFDSLLLMESICGAKYEVEDDLEEARVGWGILVVWVALICVLASGFDSLKARTLSSAKTSSFDPHIVRVWVPLPFDQILKLPSSAEQPRV